MPTTRFRYTARDNMGHEISGITEADTPSSVVQDLRSRGYDALRVEPIGPPSAKRLGRALAPAVSPYSRATFYRQLALMLRAGISVSSALESLSWQTDSAQLRRVLVPMGELTARGVSFTEAMEQQAPLFSPLEIAIVRAGEKGGFLDSSLVQLSDYFEGEVEIRRLLRVQLTYPILLLAFALVMPFGVNVFIRGVIPGSAMTLPAPLSELGNLLSVLVGAILTLVLLRLVSNYEWFRYAWDTLRLSLPVIGKTARISAMGRFGRALGALYASGVPIGEAIRLAGESSGSYIISQKTQEAVPKIQAGASIADTLAETGVFSPLLLDMLRTGERTGELSKTMSSVAHACEEESKTRAKQSATGFALGVYLAIMIYIAYIILTFYSKFYTSMLR